MRKILRPFGMMQVHIYKHTFDLIKATWTFMIFHNSMNTVILLEISLMQLCTQCNIGTTIYMYYTKFQAVKLTAHQTSILELSWSFDFQHTFGNLRLEWWDWILSAIHSIENIPQIYHCCFTSQRKTFAHIDGLYTHGIYARLHTTKATMNMK